jgi:hypothetical protein
MTDLGHGDVRLGNDLKKNEVQLKYLYKTESQSTPEGSKKSAATINKSVTSAWTHCSFWVPDQACWVQRRRRDWVRKRAHWGVSWSQAKGSG